MSGRGCRAACRFCLILPTHTNARIGPHRAVSWGLIGAHSYPSGRLGPGVLYLNACQRPELAAHTAGLRFIPASPGSPAPPPLSPACRARRKPEHHRSDPQTKLIKDIARLMARLGEFTPRCPRDPFHLASEKCGSRRAEPPTGSPQPALEDGLAPTAWGGLLTQPQLGLQNWSGGWFSEPSPRRGCHPLPRVWTPLYPWTGNCSPPRTERVPGTSHCTSFDAF